MLIAHTLHKKMKFSIKDFFSKCDQIRSFLRIWSHLLKKSLMKNFIFYVMIEERRCLKFKRNEEISSSVRLSKFCFYQTLENTQNIILSLKEEIFLTY